MISSLPNIKAPTKQPARAWAWLLCPRASKAQSRISARDGSLDAVGEGAPRREGGNQVLRYLATALERPASAYTGTQDNQEQFAAFSSNNTASGETLPDPLLFSRIKSCSSWSECQRLLAANAQQLDAMLLSTLVTQTVYVHQGLQHQHDAANATSTLQAVCSTAVGDQHQQEQHQGQRIVNGPRTCVCYNTKSRIRRSRSRSASSRIVFQHYLEQLAQISLLLMSGFRPQQFSNVLWGLAKCDYRPPPVFVHRYLAQVELQLVTFPPKNLAQLIWALATMKTKPPRTFLASFLAESGDRLAQFKPQDIANTLWALATLGVQPPADWLQSALSAAECHWCRYKPQELSITIWGFAKLGLGFKPQPASPGVTPGGGGLSPVGVDNLLAAAVRVMPIMSPQEVCNMLWGLAVAQADLAPQQVQVLAVYALRLLYNKQLASSSSSGTGDSSQDLCVCIWALTTLHWTPSHQEARLLLHLLQQQWDSGSNSSRTASCRSTATLLWCFGKLQMRPPAGLMQQMLLQVQQSLASSNATAADPVQALSGCRALGWRPSKTWWAGFYKESLGVLQVATVVELSRVLAYAAAMRPLRPSELWWNVFWHQVGTSATAKFTAYGLKREQDLAVSAVSKDSRKSSSSSSRDCWDLSSIVAGTEEPWSDLQQTMVLLMQLRAAARPLQLSGQPACMTSLTSSGLINPQSTVMLLWACAKLKRLPRKVLLWQLLVLVLVELHEYTPQQLTGIMWSAAVLADCYGKHVGHCHKALKLLVVGAQWRLHTGLLGGAADQVNYVAALGFLAHAIGVQRLLQLRWRAHCGLASKPKAAYDNIMTAAALGCSKLHAQKS